MHPVTTNNFYKQQTGDSLVGVTPQGATITGLLFRKKGFVKGSKHSEETKKHLSLVCGHPMSPENKLKLLKVNIGKKVSLETRKKMSLAKKGKPFTLEHRKNMQGINSKGGISSLSKKIRGSIEYHLWRNTVFIKDDFTCQKYKIKGCHLEAHHIKNFEEYVEGRFDVNNGITLSKKAHKEFHKKYGIKNNSLKQLKEFLCQTLK